MTEGKIEPGTVNERTKTMRHVVRWLHDQYLIPALPRQMVHLCAAYGVKTTAKALDLPMLHRLWNGASPRLKTYMALGLNCGFYVGDIASLEYSHIKGGYIVKDRHKTGVPTRFKLWSVTKALLDANANGKDKLVLVTDQGGPLLVIDPYWKNGRGRRWCKIETDLLATRKRLGINGVTFSKFRDTSSTQIESIDRTVTDLFDGHKDARMARFYVDGEMVDYDRLFAALDSALDELEEYYGLKLPT
jgi:integrase